VRGLPARGLRPPGSWRTVRCATATKVGSGPRDSGDLALSAKVSVVLMSRAWPGVLAADLRRTCSPVGGAVRVGRSVRELRPELQGADGRIEIDADADRDAGVAPAAASLRTSAPPAPGEAVPGAPVPPTRGNRLGPLRRSSSFASRQGYSPVLAQNAHWCSAANPAPGVVPVGVSPWICWCAMVNAGQNGALCPFGLPVLANRAQ
jgi:hypothetical protein